MKHLLFYIAAAIALVVAAVYLWGKCFSTKPTSPDYEMGKGRGIGTDFMDSSKADAGITPVKGDLGLIAKPTFPANPWFGKMVAIKSTVPTGNPVRTQLKTIW